MPLFVMSVTKFFFQGSGQQGNGVFGLRHLALAVCVKPASIGLNDRALTCGVIHLLCNLSYLMSDGKAFLGGSGIDAQVWVMDLEPHALGALAIGHQL
jgi:hypothetical protein